MRRLLILIFGLVITISMGCVLPGPNDGTNPSDMNKVIDDLLHLKSIQSIETTLVDDELLSSRTGYYTMDTEFKGFAEINNTVGNITEYSNVAVYNLDAQTCVRTTTDNYFNNYIPLSIFEYLGVDQILNNAKKRVVNNNLIKGSVTISKAMGILNNLVYELGLSQMASELINGNEISYEISLADTKLNYLKVDLTNVLKQVDAQITTASKMYVFNAYQNYDYPDMPTINGELNNDAVNKIKTAAIEYIDVIFKNIEYISDDLRFPTIYPKSGKIDYLYIVSDESILNNKGQFTYPDNDTLIELTINILYDEVLYATLNYDFWCLAEFKGSGTYGSITNPLYSGKRATDKLDVYYIEMVKQYGDAIYIKSGDFDMLIDAGQAEDSSNVRDILKEYVYDQTLECVIATHAHSDHIGGMVSALQAVTNINYVVDFGYDRQEYGVTQTYRNYIQANSKAYYSVYDAVHNQNGALKTVYITEDFYLEFLDTNEYIPSGIDISGGDDNNASVTFILNYQGKKFYFSGDIGSSVESCLVSSNQLSDVDVMKATHHGTPNGNSLNLLRKITPEIVVVSAALIKPGSKGSNAQDQVHPSSKALNNFYNVGAKVYCNFTNGTIKVRVENANISLQGLGSIRGYYLNGNLIIEENNLEFKDTRWAQKYR